MEDRDWVNNPACLRLLALIRGITHDPGYGAPSYRERDGELRLIQLVEYGNAFRKLRMNNERLKQVWGMALVHCLRDPFSKPRFDVHCEHAERGLALLREICFPDGDARRFAVTLLLAALNGHWLKEVDLAALRFTVEGFQLIYSFTRRADKTLDGIRELDSELDYEEPELPDFDSLR
jgi:hypothetical protein